MKTEPNAPASGLNTQNGHYPGLTKREHFAGLAMQAWISADHVGNAGYPFEEMANRAIDCADALIAELNKPITP